jgi:hypothetical protein
MFVYLIASHGDGRQLPRLIRRIREERPQARIVVHHDRKSAPRVPAEDLAAVEFVSDPVDVRWGDFSMVEMVLHAARWLLAEGRPGFDWVVLLSAQDYPAVSLAEFEERVSSAEVDGFLDFAPAETAYAAENARRYDFSYRVLPGWAARPLGALDRRNPFPRSVQFAAGRIGARIGFPARRSPFGPRFRCYRGAFWWTLSRAPLRYLVDYAAAHPDVVAHYRRTLHPDESFVQTVLLNAGRFRLSPDYGRYIAWTRPTDIGPRVLTAPDLPAILDSGAAFARKFDPAVDTEVLDALDRAATWGEQAPNGSPDGTKGLKSQGPVFS